jgi:hypothetical protein
VGFGDFAVKWGCGRVVHSGEDGLYVIEDMMWKLFGGTGSECC